jgi:YD repeat-containing protein
MKRCLLTICIALAAQTAILAESVTYSYDAAGRLTRAVYSGGTVVDYAYDAAGSLLSRTVSSGSPSPIGPTMTAGKSGALVEVRYSIAECTSSDHAILVGSLSDFRSVTEAHCTVGNSGVATISAPGGNAWFLVAGVESTAYSSVGASSAGERLLLGVDAACPGFIQDISRTCP